MFCNKSAEKLLSSSINLYRKQDEQDGRIVQLRLFQPVQINDSNSAKVKKFIDLCK